jgi:hypothetical protein
MGATSNKTRTPSIRLALTFLIDPEGEDELEVVKIIFSKKAEKRKWIMTKHHGFGSFSSSRLVSFQEILLLKLLPVLLILPV